MGRQDWAGKTDSEMPVASWLREEERQMSRRQKRLCLLSCSSEGEERRAVDVSRFSLSANWVSQELAMAFWGHRHVDSGGTCFRPRHCYDCPGISKGVVTMICRNAITAVVFSVLALIAVTCSLGQEPPAINPFGQRQRVREDAIPGYVELSDDTILPGHIHLTRDARLKIADRALERHREIPLKRIKEVECEVEKEWMQKEWRFRENADDRKVFTGKSYPARIYVHTVTLTDDRKIRGDLSGILYLQRPEQESTKFVLHQRDKGPVGTGFDSLVHVRRIRLGDKALEEGQERLKEKQERN